MRLGLQEIGIIIVVIVFIIVLARMSQASKNTNGGDAAPEISGRGKNKAKVKRKPRNHFRIVGIIFVAAGIVTMIANISLLKWAIWTNVWAAVIIALGFGAIALSRHR